MPLQILNITSPSILKNKVLQQALNDDGITQFPFLSDSALSQLILLYQSFHKEFPKGPIPDFFVSTHSSDMDYKLTIESEIKRIIEPFCENHFKEYRLITSVLLLKKPSPESELGLHQDWTAVDESKYASYGLWIPLVDVTIQNGAISVLKRSHKIGPTYRHTKLPNVYANIGNIVDKYLVPIEAKAGHAILFNQSLLHKSAANLSQNIRPSIVSTITPKSATHLMYAPSQSPNMLSAWIIKDDYVQRLTSFFEDSLNVPEDALKTDINVVADFTPILAEDFERLYLSLF